MTYLFGLPISAAILCFSDSIVTAISGTGYSGATLLLALLGSQLWLSFINGLQGSLIAAGDKPYSAVKAAGTITGVGIVLDLLLIKYFGSVGAAVTTVIAQIVGVFVFARFNRLTNFIVLKRPPPGSVVGALVMGTIGIVTAPSSLFLAIVLGAALYGITLLVSRTVTTDDIRQLVAWLKRHEGPWVAE